MESKSEELFKIVTAYRFIAMLMMLLVAIMGHYGIGLDPEVASYMKQFLMGFIIVNTTGKVSDKIAGAIKESGSQNYQGEI